MPTPSGRIVSTDSKTRTSMPISWRHRAAVSPPIPPPAMRDFMAPLFVPGRRRFHAAVGVAAHRLPRQLLERAVELLVPRLLLGPLEQAGHRQPDRAPPVDHRVV